MIQLIAYPQGTDMTASGFLENTILDLYKDEPIPLTLTIDNFTNVLENTSSYSLPMKIPGTKTNNKFFKHIYNITADSSTGYLFNPHTRTPIILKENTIDTFSGYMELVNIVKKGGAISYKIVLYSEAINLKDKLAELVMRDLDFSELNHSFNSLNIIDSWTGDLELDATLPADSFAGSGTTTDVCKYPAVRWNTNTNYNSGLIKPDDMTDLFRPWIKLKYILQMMFRASGFSFTSTFFDSSDFDKLYIDFNKGWEQLYHQAGNFTTKNSLSVSYPGNTLSIIEFDTIVNNYNIVGSNFYDTSTNIFTVPIGTYFVEMQWDITVATGSTEVKFYTYMNGLQYGYMGSAMPGDNIYEWWGAVVIPVVTGETITVRCKSLTPFSLSSSSQVDYKAASETTKINDTLDGYKGDTNQWEFFKGVIDMFKLVIMRDENDLTNLLIEPYKDWVNSGNLVDLSNKVDDKNFKYSIVNGLAKNLRFAFAEDENDWITLNHNHPNDRKYSYNLTTDLELFDKKDNIIEVPEFASTYCSANSSLGGEFYVPAIIANDTSQKNWENKWRILYDNGVVSLPTHELQVQSFTKDEYLLFSPCDDYPISASNSLSYNFGVVNYSGPGGYVLNGLYNVYWFRYIDELYHPDTRIIQVTAFLTATDIKTIKFNDIILIKNKKYRLSKIDYRAGRKSKLELINIKDL